VEVRGAGVRENALGNPPSLASARWGKVIREQKIFAQ